MLKTGFITKIANRNPKSSRWVFRKLIALLCVFLPLAACVALEPSQDNNKSAKMRKSEVATPKSSEARWLKHQQQVDAINSRAKIQNKNETNLTQLKKSFNVKNRMSLGADPQHLAGRKFSFDTEDTDIQIALREFASKYKLNMFIDQDIEGSISVDFKNLPLKKAMTLLLGSHNYFWSWDNGLIRISRLQTKTFVIDYLRLTRSGQAATNSSISIETVRNEKIAEDNERNSTSIEKNDSLAFWDELENQISTLISDNGRFVINRLSGTVQITDIPSRIREVDSFIASLQKALHRQVEIDVRIFEVTLRDDNALGIDWSAINIAGIAGSLTSTITGGNNGLGLKSSTLSLGYNNGNFSALISALKEQGSIKVVSQPRIRVMNNQPSLIKVGTDRTFFTQTVSHIASTASANNIILSDTPVTITEGLVLSVTPQISDDRWIMLDISPVMTRVVDTVTSVRGSTAPVLDIKQASTLIRARDGEMIILGGLIQDSASQTGRQVPFFAKLPLFGGLFEGNYATKVKKELVIFLVPRLIL